MGQDHALVAIRKTWNNLKEQVTIDENMAKELERSNYLGEHALLVEELDLDETEKIQTVIACLLVLLGLFHAVISQQDDRLVEFSPDSGFKEPARMLIADYGLESFFDPRILDLLQEESDQAIASSLAEIATLLEKHGFDPFGIFFQQMMAPRTRKRYAANYTVSFILDLLAGLAIEESGGLIIDPFVGSGKLLAAVIKRESKLDSSELATILQRLYGIDLFKSAVMLSTCQLAFTCHEQGIPVPRDYYKSPRINQGDSFESLQPQGDRKLGSYFRTSDFSSLFPNRFDLIIQNPPYSRYTSLSKKYTEFLKKRFSRYGKYLKHQMGLHGFALMLADEMLNEEGRIAAVLPASILYSSYGTGLKQLLLDRYQVEFLITSELVKAFSEGSDFREILLICKKTTKGNTPRQQVKCVSLRQHPGETELPGVIISLKETSFTEEENAFFSIKCVNQAELEASGNWMVHFFPSNHEDLVTDLSRKINLVTGREMDFHLFRGFEMYGPDFFFVPNKFWELTRVNDTVITIRERTGSSSSKTYNIPIEYFPAALRKPSFYRDTITPVVNHRVLRVPPDVKNQGVQDYIALNESHAVAAQKQFGNDWYSHVFAQFKTKNPIGRVFLVDKFSVSSAALIAHFTDELLAASKNFYILKSEILEKDKFHAAWLNSSIFLILFLHHRREIGGSFGRLQIVDYLSRSLFVKYVPSSKHLAKILEAFDQLRSLKLPPLDKQMNLPQRQQLDLVFLQYLGFTADESKNMLSRIYMVLEERFKVLKARDRSKS
jgi:type I restriction-modification system DNA methylase subunit